MRCGRARKLIVTAVDGESTPADRRALDEHVTVCADCRRELAVTQSLFGALGNLATATEVPPLVEAATLRRMRIAAAEEREAGTRRWWGWLPVPMLAAAGVGVIALGIGTRPGNAPEPVRAAPEPAEARRIARAPEAPTQPAAAPGETEVATATARVLPPQDPPPDLAAAPDLFMNLPIIRNMEKLEHFEAISMVELAPNG